MKLLKALITVVVILISVSIPFQVINGKMLISTTNKASSVVKDLYNQLRLDVVGLDYNVFNTAMMGHNKLLNDKKIIATNIISIIDLSQPSCNKRLYILDLEKQKILFHTYVSHGKNSGELYATTFSNKPSSLQSSLGFYVTGDVYQGKHGLSLKLFGQEPGFNDEALHRAIVLHGADYVSEAFIKNTGRLGRSFGCPAVASELATPIINTIQNGSCLFVYHPDPTYQKKSLLATTKNY